MYVYYENYKYVSNGANYSSTSFYTHQITVIENVSESKFLSLKRKNWDCKASYSKRNRKAYLRKTMRIAKVSRYHKTHQFYSRAKRTYFAQVENFGLDIYLDKDYEDDSKIISNVLD